MRLVQQGRPQRQWPLHTERSTGQGAGRCDAAGSQGGATGRQIRHHHWLQSFRQQRRPRPHLLQRPPFQRRNRKQVGPKAAPNCSRAAGRAPSQERANRAIEPSGRSLAVRARLRTSHAQHLEHLAPAEVRTQRTEGVRHPLSNARLVPTGPLELSAAHRDLFGSKSPQPARAARDSKARWCIGSACHPSFRFPISPRPTLRAFAR